MIKVSAICSGRILRNLFVCCCFFFFFLLHEEGNTHSSWISLIAFVYNTWPWLITQWLPGFPWGSWLYRIFKMHSTAPWEWCCCVEGLAIFLPGNITKTTEVGGVQNLAEGAHEPLINAHDEITMLILESPPPLQNHVIDFIFKSAMLTSSTDATLCQFFWRLPLVFNALQVHHRAQRRPGRRAAAPSQEYFFFFFFKTNEAHRLLPLPLLSVSFSLPANLSFFLTLMPK